MSAMGLGLRICAAGMPAARFWPASAWQPAVLRRSLLPCPICAWHPLLPPACLTSPPFVCRSRNCCKRRFGWLLEHTEPQTTCLFDDQGQPAVDFLGRVENLDEDMQVCICACSCIGNVSKLPSRQGRVENLDEDMQVGTATVAGVVWLETSKATWACRWASALHVPRPASSLSPAMLCLPAVQELVQLINSRLDAGVEPLKVGELPRFQLARQDMEDQEEARWRYYSEFYANSSTGGRWFGRSCSSTVCCGSALALLLRVLRQQQQVGVGYTGGRGVQLCWHLCHGARLQHAANLSGLIWHVPAVPSPSAALQDIRNYFHADFDLLKVPMPAAGGGS